MAITIPSPGTVVPAGSLITPSGGQGAQGPPGPTGPNNSGPFILKSAAYIIQAADVGAYFICSGGSWTLTLPAPASAFWFRVRNDMGITGTTGTITLTPPSGTIDGAASLALLPGQNCTVICDGTNWRTFGLQREVVLGTQDITTAVANAVILLPAGYRYFELEFNGFIPSVTPASLNGALSTDGGTTWLAASYYWGTIYNTSTTAVAFADYESNAGPFLIGLYTVSSYSAAKMILFPGSTTANPTWTIDSLGWSSNVSKYQTGGFYNALVRVNALKYQATSGNINQCALTVKGIV
jgi:hypothetical protein